MRRPSSLRSAYSITAVLLVCAAVGYVVWLLAWGKSISDIEPKPLWGLAGAFLLCVHAHLNRSRERGQGRAPRGGRIAAGFLVLWSLALIGWSQTGPFLDLVRDGDVRAWSDFHYYLGSKYFPELGYDGLYEQALAADAEGNHFWKDVPSVRDLRTYEVKSIRSLELKRSPAFTDERWAEFTADVCYLQPQLRQSQWDLLFRDRGYNPPPTWTVIGQQLTRLDVGRGNLIVLGLLDPLLLLLALLFAAWALGVLRALVAAAWLSLFFGAWSMLHGAIFQFDYVAALVVMVALMRRGRPGMAGGMLGYAAMVRVFPGVLLIGMLAWIVLRWWRTRSVPGTGVRFVAGFALAAAILAGVGCFNGRGLGAWPEFVEAIEVHSEDHRFGNRRLGLQHAFTQPWSPDAAVIWPGKQIRREAWQRQHGAWLVGALILSALWIVATMRREERDPLVPMLTSAILIFAWIVTSRYYGSAACIFILAAPGRQGVKGALPVAMVTAMMGLEAVHGITAITTHSKFGPYLVVNVSIALSLLVLLVARVLRPRQPPQPMSVKVADPLKGAPSTISASSRVRVPSAP